MVKKIFCAFLIISLLFSYVFTVNAYEPTGVDITATSALLVSLDTGEVIYEKNASQKVYPASITKIMTTILILESDKFAPDAKIAMSESALDLISGTGSSVSLLKAGDEMTQLDLAYMILMSSFGDCSLLAAEYYGGSVENFVAMMNTKANELGLTGTYYQNPIGLHTFNNKSADDVTYTTAYDTYTLTKYALQNETFKTICETDRYTVNEGLSTQRTLSTTNALQDRNTNYFYPYAKGVKTGFTDEAGRCLVSTATKDGLSYMCILFGCPPNEKSALYNWAFDTFELKTVANTATPVAEVKVNLSNETDFISVYVEKGVTSILPKDADESTITIKPHLNAAEIDAPVKKGQFLGTADVIYAEKVIGTVNLVAGGNAEKSPMLSFIGAIKNFFTSSYMKTLYTIIVIVILLGIAFIVTSIVLLNSKKKKARKIKYKPYREKKENKQKKSDS